MFCAKSVLPRSFLDLVLLFDGRNGPAVRAAGFTGTVR